jgi:hypothetical protein
MYILFQIFKLPHLDLVDAAAGKGRGHTVLVAKTRVL